MDWAKILPKAGAVALAVVGEIKDDLKDEKLTVDEIIDTTKAVVDKLGYGSKAIVNFTKGK